MIIILGIAGISWISFVGVEQLSLFQKDTAPYDNPVKPSEAEPLDGQASSPSPMIAAPSPIEQTKPDIRRVTLSAVGDIMMHMPQTQAGIQSDGTRDYTYFFESIKPYIEASDLALGNLELTISPNEQFSGFPLFKAPVEILDALKQSGFDVLFTANNHSMDNFETGILHTLNQIEERGLKAAGTHRTPEEDKPVVITVNGITIGIASYSYSTNGIPVPKDKPYLINLIDREKMRQNMIELDRQQVDFKIVGLHFGLEYQRVPSPEQKEIVQYLNTLGVDAVIGTHPHVLQPTEWIQQPGYKKTFVVYSLGNFISNQQDPYTDSGMILQLTLVKNTHTRQSYIGKVEGIPTVVVRPIVNGRKNYRVVPVGTMIEESGGTDQPVWKDWRGRGKSYYQKMWDDVDEMFEINLVKE